MEAASEECIQKPFGFILQQPRSGAWNWKTLCANGGQLMDVLGATRPLNCEGVPTDIRDDRFGRASSPRPSHRDAKRTQDEDGVEEDRQRSPRPRVHDDGDSTTKDHWLQQRLALRLVEVAIDEARAGTASAENLQRLLDQRMRLTEELRQWEPFADNEDSSTSQHVQLSSRSLAARSSAARNASGELSGAEIMRRLLFDSEN